MSTLRQAAEMALEALEYGQHTLKQVSENQWESRGQLAVQAFRAALAEPDLFHCPKCGGPADNGHDRSIPPSPYWCTKCMAEPEQEPVAWSYELATTMLEHGYDGWEHLITRYKPNVPEGSIRNLTPLYTSPPQRKPLTEEEMKKLLIESAGMTIQLNDVDFRLARSIERAHEIT